MEKPYKVHVEREKVLDWLRKGAQMSNTVENLLRKEGIVQEFNLEKRGSKLEKTTEKEAEKKETSGTDQKKPSESTPE